MSGIAVVFERDGAPADASLVAAMMGRLAHRGPDGSRVITSGGVGMGHCLLATTDSDALGPERSERLWIVADARLDNRADLLAALEIPSDARDMSEASLLLRAYARWGHETPAHLLGDFAFAIWDETARQLFCARDHVGVRPLFYHEDRGAFRCASEMHALFADARLPRRAHDVAMGLFVADLYTERDQTLYRDVFALPNGHRLVATPTSLSVEPYWRPDPWRQVRRAGDDAYAEEFGTVFREAVRCRMRSKGPLGFLVSGGLDSSSVACVAEDLHGSRDAASPQRTLLHLAFDDLPCDESQYIAAVAARCASSELVEAHPLALPDLLKPDPARLHPDLYYLPTMVMGEPLAKLGLERGIRATLTGMGGDDLMSPTGLEAADALQRWDLASFLRALDTRSSAPGASRQSLRSALRPLLPEWAVAWRNALRPPRRPRWLAPRLADEVEDIRRARARRRGARTYPGRVAEFLYSNFEPDTDLLLFFGRLDKSSARYGTEYRHPFYDLRVIELLLALPQEQRVRGRVVKPVLRRAMRNTLPPVVRERPDAAEFSSYVREALVVRHAEELRRLFASSRLADWGIISPDVGAEFQGGRFELNGGLEQLISLELWVRHSFP